MTSGPGDRPRFAVAVLCGLATWGVYFALVWPRMLFERADGVYAGMRTVWGDWALHFAYAGVFAYRPPQGWFDTHPLFVTRPGFDYPVLADALSGLLMRAGVDPILAFVGPSLLATAALIALLSAFYALKLGTPLRALLATTLFFANGGMGFVLLAMDWLREPSLGVLVAPPREYTHLPALGIRWINIVFSEIFPQRALLLGLPLTLAVLLPLWRYSQRAFEGVGAGRLVALGLVPGVILAAHVHSYLVLGVLCGLLFAASPGCYRSWLTFAGAAALSSLLVFLLLYGDTARAGYAEWYPGWLAHPREGHDLSVPLFLWLNWGAFLPLAAFSFACFRYYRDPLILGGALLFLLCLLVRLQPNTWDNTKILTWAHLLLCVPVARYLADLWGRGRLPFRALAVGLALFCTASGFVELWRTARTEELAVRMWSTPEIALARTFRDTTPPDAIVLCSDRPHHWVPSLTGRRVLLGYRGWLRSYGIDYDEVEGDVATMLAGAPGTEALLRRYGVDYAVIGPEEERVYEGSARYFLEHHELVLEDAGYRVFRIGEAPSREDQ